MSCILYKWPIYGLLINSLAVASILEHQGVVYQHPYDGPALAPMPFQASLEWTNEKGYRVHFCSGSIVSESHVLTAAHCFSVMPMQRVYVTVGSNVLDLTKNAAPVHKYYLTSLITHQLYQPLHGYDVALVKVSPKFHLDGVYVDKISYGSKEHTPPNVLGYLPSFGRGRPGYSYTLHVVSFRTVSTEFSWQRGFRHVSNRDLCAYSYKNDSFGACDGDSGAALLNYNMNSILGILSYGRRPCEARHIYVFTSAWAVYDWITYHIS